MNKEQIVKEINFNEKGLQILPCERRKITPRDGEILPQSIRDCMSTLESLIEEKTQLIEDTKKNISKAKSDIHMSHEMIEYLIDKFPEESSSIAMRVENLNKP